MLNYEDSLPPASDFYSFDDILKVAHRKEASDVHLSCERNPKFRIDGDIVDGIGGFTISSDWMNEEIRKLLNLEQLKEYEAKRDFDLSHAVEGHGRFRVNLYQQLGTPSAVFRLIPDKIKSLEELNLPESLSDISHKPNGLVLVTGPTGSGKSTTLAAMIEERNRRYKEHILTIEDPVEFIYESKKAIINQREVGVGADTRSFHEALKRALRQDPDVILIGELRDPETIEIALNAAETGHLVFGTLHTQSAAKSINRIIGSFPPSQQPQIRSQLGVTLRAIISQSLLKRKGGGRVAATEIMVSNNAIANQIEEGAIKQIFSSIQSGSRDGMHTLDQNLKKLIFEGIIDRDEALEYAHDPKAIRGA